MTMRSNNYLRPAALLGLAIFATATVVHVVMNKIVGHISVNLVIGAAAALWASKRLQMLTG